MFLKLDNRTRIVLYQSSAPGAICGYESVGVAYGLETPFFPQLAAPNVAPNIELYRRTDSFCLGVRR